MRAYGGGFTVRSGYIPGYRANGANRMNGVLLRRSVCCLTPNKEGKKMRDSHPVHTESSPVNRRMKTKKTALDTEYQMRNMIQQKKVILFSCQQSGNRRHVTSASISSIVFVSPGGIQARTSSNEDKYLLNPS